jgi:hypothetical protein
MDMRVDIQPYWKKLANWYWNNAGGYEGVGMSIWEMLEHEYGAVRVYYGGSGGKLGRKNDMMVSFPNEQSYTVFLLRWA